MDDVVRRLFSDTKPSFRKVNNVFEDIKNHMDELESHGKFPLPPYFWKYKEPISRFITIFFLL